MKKHRIYQSMLVFLVFATTVFSSEAIYAQYSPRGGRVINKSQNKVLVLTQKIDSTAAVSTEGYIGLPASKVNGEYSIDANGVVLSSTQLAALGFAMPMNTSFTRTIRTPQPYLCSFFYFFLYNGFCNQYITSSVTQNYTQISNTQRSDVDTKQDAERWIEINRGNLINSLRAAMNTYKVGNVWFNLSQDVRVQINDAALATLLGRNYKEQKLVWSVSMDKNSDPNWSGVRLVDPDPYMVEATYRPRGIADGLPAEYQVLATNPGILAYRVKTINGDPVIPASNGDPSIEINTQGLFDEANPGPGVDTEAGAKCLIDNSQSFCNDAQRNFKDIKTLMSDVGAVFGRLSYSRRLQPVFDAVETAPGVYTQEARYLLTIDTRQLITNANCSVKDYRNKGSQAYQLMDYATLYQVNQGGSYSSQGATQPTILPTAPNVYYDQTKQVASTYTGATLAPWIINPADAGANLVASTALTSTNPPQLAFTSGAGTIQELNPNNLCLPPAEIEVLSATYGANCGAGAGNRTGLLQSFANGRTNYEININNGSMQGDPAFGCGKDFRLTYQCKNTTFGQRTIYRGGSGGEGYGVRLSCEADPCPGSTLQQDGYCAPIFDPNEYYYYNGGGD